VEVQELTCKALIANVWFALTPLLGDNRGQLIRRMSKLLRTEEFGWQSDRVTVFSTDHREHFELSSRDLVASCEHSEDFEQTAGRIRVFVEQGLRRWRWTASLSGRSGLR
jgi:hypothetical protein